MHTYTDTLHSTQREASITTTILQDIPTFDGQDSSKLKDWFMDIETNILKESQTHLAEAKSCSLTHTLSFKATLIGKCWDEIKGILSLKLYNTNIHTYTSCFMEIQQKDNETLAAYIHHFKMAANHCDFDNDTVAIYIFVKGLKMHTPSELKIYEKDTQTMSEVIRLVWKTQCSTTTNSHTNTPMVSMKSNNDRCLVCGWTCHIDHQCPDEKCYGCDEFGHFAQDCTNKIAPWEHHATKIYLIKGISKPTDHTWCIIVPDRGEISADHNLTAIPTMTGVAVSEGTHCTLYLATTVAHAALLPMDAPMAIWIMTHPTGIVTPNLALVTSSTDLTHATIPQTGAGLTSATPTEYQHIALNEDYSQNSFYISFWKMEISEGLFWTGTSWLYQHTSKNWWIKY